VAEHLPDDAVAFDGFRIVNLVNEKLGNLRGDHVSEVCLPQMEEALRHNHPLLMGYLLKDALGLMWEQPSRARKQGYLLKWCPWASDSGVNSGRKVRQGGDPIVRHPRHSGLAGRSDQQRTHGRHQ
jgi:hypothetical protein